MMILFSVIQTFAMHSFYIGRYLYLNIDHVNIYFFYNYQHYNIIIYWSHVNTRTFIQVNLDIIFVYCIPYTNVV